MEFPAGLRALHTPGLGCPLSRKIVRGLYALLSLALLEHAMLQASRGTRVSYLFLNFVSEALGGAPHEAFITSSIPHLFYKLKEK